jgi:hypothetical protein
VSVEKKGSRCCAGVNWLRRRLPVFVCRPVRVLSFSPPFEHSPSRGASRRARLSVSRMQPPPYSGWGITRTLEHRSKKGATRPRKDCAAGCASRGRTPRVLFPARTGTGTRARSSCGAACRRDRLRQLSLQVLVKVGLRRVVVPVVRPVLQLGLGRLGLGPRCKGRAQRAGREGGSERRENAPGANADPYR